jgi:hypothetical protein
MAILTKIKLGRLAGYLWLCFLCFVLLLSARSAFRQSLQTEEYPHSCDPFGYLEMAKEFRQSASFLEIPTFKIESKQTRLLIDLMQANNLRPPVWNNLVGPHAYHYFPKAGHVGVQYPPGTGLTLALFPEGKAVYWLNVVVVSMLTIVGVLTLLLAALRQAWASAALIILALYVGFEILDRLGSLSFSINVVMIPLLLACLLSFVALWLRNKRQQSSLAWLAAFVAGLCLGYAVLVRLPSIFFVPGFLLLLWPSGGWRSTLKGLPGALCLAIFLGGLIPLFVHQQLTAGAWYVTTYSPSVQTNLPTVEILQRNFHYYFGKGYQTEDNWSLLGLISGFSGWVIYSHVQRNRKRSHQLGIGWKRLALSGFIIWGLPTGFFLTQSLTGLHYMMAQNFALLTFMGFGSLAIEASSTLQKAYRGNSKRMVVTLVGMALVFLPAFVCARSAWRDRVRTPFAATPVAHKAVVLPPDLADGRAWVWADVLTGTLWYYAKKPAFRVQFSNSQTRFMVYRFVYERREPQYIIRDSENIDGLMSEIAHMGGAFEPRGQVDGQPYFLIHWPEAGPQIAMTSNVNR